MAQIERTINQITETILSKLHSGDCNSRNHIHNQTQKKKNFTFHKNNYCNFYSLQYLHLSYTNRDDKFKLEVRVIPKHIYVISGVEHEGEIEEMA